MIIGLSGRKQSGKNTAARHIEEELGRYWEIQEYSYADYLKQTCIDLFGLTREQCYGTDEQKNSPTKLTWGSFLFIKDLKLPAGKDRETAMTGREVLQVWGTDVVRRVYSNAWVDATIRKIKADRKVSLALITDVRFPNEVEAIQQAGGHVLRLTRVPFSTDVHESELALDADRYNWNLFDAVIDNVGMSVEEQREPIMAQVLKWL